MKKLVKKIGDFFNKIFKRNQKLYQKPNIISPSSENHPIVINIKNNSDEKKEVYLFGFNALFHKPNFGNDKEITVSINNDFEYAEILKDLSNKKILTSIIRLTGKNVNDFPQTIKLHTSNVRKMQKIEEQAIITFSYFSAYQQQSTIIDCPYSLEINSSKFISFELKGKTEITISFFYDEIDGYFFSRKPNINPLVKSLKKQSIPYLNLK